MRKARPPRAGQVWVTKHDSDDPGSIAVFVVVGLHGRRDVGEQLWEVTCVSCAGAYAGDDKLDGWRSGEPGVFGWERFDKWLDLIG